MSTETILAFLNVFVLMVASILALAWKNSDEARELHRKKKGKVDFLTGLILFR